MGFMTSPASDSLKEIIVRLDQRILAVDEERWLSSRYASPAHREVLIVLYAFYYELARVRVAVSDATLGQIRFQWWRDALSDMALGHIRQHDVVLALAKPIEQEVLKQDDLLRLVDRHEAAFMADDRSLEPEGDLAQIAVRVLGGADETRIEEIAQVWSALRRGDPAPGSVTRFRVTSTARPAVAHFRLRHAWSSGPSIGAFMRRVIVFVAMLTGRI